MVVQKYLANKKIYLEQQHDEEINFDCCVHD